jgi:hypothetical protein
MCGKEKERIVDSPELFLKDLDPIFYKLFNIIRNAEKIKDSSNNLPNELIYESPFSNISDLLLDTLKVFFFFFFFFFFYL